MEQYSLIIEGRPEKNEFLIGLKKWEGDKLIFSKSYKIRQVDTLHNRIILDSKIPISCREVSGELFCGVEDISVGLPRICVRKEVDGEIKLACGLDKIEWDDALLATSILERAEKLKKGIIDFMARHNITLLLDYTMERPRTGEAMCTRYACYIGLNVGLPRTLREYVSTFMHEFAHVREDIARAEKGLEEAKGKWIRADRLIPVGMEERAEKFKKRVMRLW